VKYTLWNRKKGVGKISTDTTLNIALSLLQKKLLVARPISKPTGSWQTISKKQIDLRAIEGENFYKARRGASTDPYGVFWLEIIQVKSDGNLIASNLFEKGKWKIKQVTEVLESEFVYPAVSGKNIDRWNATPREYVLIVQDPKERKGYSEMIMKNNYPRTYSYLLKFKEILLSRAAYKKYYADSNHPFYSQYNIADYSFTRYKVVWKRMANDIIATVISQYKTPFDYKTIISTDTTSLIATDDENEAHYICSIINSVPVREFIKSYSSAGRGFGAPSVMQHIAIPKFESQNEIHKKLTMISKNCHKLKAEGKENELGRLEDDNVELVRTLFGI